MIDRALAGLPLIPGIKHTIRASQSMASRLVAALKEWTTDGPSVGALNRENFAASALTLSMDRPQVNGLNFQAFQRSRRAIRAGVSVAKLLSNLHFVPSCNRFGYRTLNQ